MKRAVITGLGFITSIGNNRQEVTESLRTARTGVERFSEFEEPGIPVKLAGTVKGFGFPSPDFEDWTFPDRHKIPRETLRPMTPNALYAYFAMREAIEDAGLPPEMVSSVDTGLTCASGGSMWMAYNNLHTMLTRGIQRVQPMAIINGIPGSLYVNLVPAFKIKGPSVGMASACSSSSHALGAAVDLIRLGRQKTVFVVGAEDCNKYTILPFASVRALSVQTDPAKSPCAFDVKRDGFVGTGGAAVLVVEELEHAQERGAQNIYAEVLGWGQASDGYNVLAPDPDGDGLARTMQLALADAETAARSDYYINAHATSTPFGDASEIKAIKRVFPGGRACAVCQQHEEPDRARAVAGRGDGGGVLLVWRLRRVSSRFRRISPNWTRCAKACRWWSNPWTASRTIVMNNSSGFGGTNVATVLRRWEG